jgi:hypothetical protein
MLKSIKKFGALSLNEKLFFSEAYFLQLTVGLLLKLIPFRKIPRLFSSPSRLTPPVSPLIPEQIKQAIQRSGRVAPWRNKCLVQSLAARRMLNRRKISSQLSFGVAKGANGRTIAHAWLKAGDFEIVEKGADFSALYLF